jgi:hypothetical protein
MAKELDLWVRFRYALVMIMGAPGINSTLKYHPTVYGQTSILHTQGLNPSKAMTDVTRKSCVCITEKGGGRFRGYI